MAEVLNPDGCGGGIGGRIGPDGGTCSWFCGGDGPIAPNCAAFGCDGRMGPPRAGGGSAFDDGG